MTVYFPNSSQDCTHTEPWSGLIGKWIGLGYMRYTVKHCRPMSSLDMTSHKISDFTVSNSVQFWCAFWLCMFGVLVFWSMPPRHVDPHVWLTLFTLWWNQLIRNITWRQRLLFVCNRSSCMHNGWKENFLVCINKLGICFALYRLHLSHYAHLGLCVKRRNAHAHTHLHLLIGQYVNIGTSSRSVCVCV